MARSVIAVAKGSTNGNAIVTATALTAGATGAAAYMAVAQNRDERFGLLVTNTGSATGTIWVKASDAYIEKDLGDLAVVVGGSVTHLIGPLEGQRFTQSGSTGAINIDSGITGTIQAVEI